MRWLQTEVRFNLSLVTVFSGYLYSLLTEIAIAAVVATRKTEATPNPYMEDDHFIEDFCIDY